MALVGSFVVGDGTLVGNDGLTAPQQTVFDVLAGQTPALPSLRRPVRARCAEICQFDPLTWTAGAPLPFISKGAVRSASLTGVGFQQETLTFTISNSTYYYAHPNLLKRGAWLCVRWTVATPFATISFLGGVFRVDEVPSPSRMGALSTFNVVALDWAQPTLLQRINNAFVAPALLLNGLIAYLATTLPKCVDATSFVPGGPSCWGNILAGYVLTHSGAPYTASPPEYGMDVTVPWGTQGAGGLSLLGEFFQIGDPGKQSSGYDVLTFMFFEVGGFTLAYGTDARLLLYQAGPVGHDSGLYVSTDTVIAGAIPIPWALPMDRKISRPQFARAQYGQHVLPDPAAVHGTLGAQDFGPRIIVTTASSSPVNPFDELRDNTDVTIDTIPEPIGVLTTQNAVMGQNWGYWKLSTALGPADTISLQVDAAFPPPPLGQLVRVHMPPDIDAWCRLVAFTQPLSATLAQWTLEWWGTAVVPPSSVDYARLMSWINSIPVGSNELPFVWVNWLSPTVSDFVGVYLASAPHTTNPADAIVTTSTGALVSGRSAFIDLNLIVSTPEEPVLYEIRGVYSALSHIVIGTQFIVVSDSAVCGSLQNTIGPAPNSLDVFWAHFAPPTAGDFIGTYLASDPHTTNIADAREFVMTGGVATGSSTITNLGDDPGTYEVRGVFGSPPQIVIGNLFESVP